MEEKIFLEGLNREGVSVIKKKYIMEGGKEYSIGLPVRCSYMNSPKGREQLKEYVADPYYSAIMLLWGETPVLDD